MTEMLALLLTDIEGSTQRWERAPDAMRAALARHDAVLRSAVTENEGRVLKSTGDGLWAIFRDPVRAIEAAVRAVREIDGAAWDDIDGLRIRAGVHVTPWSAIEERDGDLHGSAMNRCARMTDLAHGGQILCSSATADLAEPAGRSWTLRSLGTHRMRDLREPDDLYQVMHPDLRPEFPALASLDAFAHNLPVQRSSFVGRQDEMGELVQEVSISRLVTLTGAGGAGKTRLALAVAAELVERFRHGVWLVDLAALRDPGLLPAVLASTLGLREQQGRAIEETLVEHLRERDTLLLLDNCEHLLRDCAVLSDRLLGTCPQVHLLVTSRERIGVAGEVVRQVRPLTVPDPDHMDDPDADAVRLFLDRAMAVAPDLELTGGAREAVGRICRRLDGIPLAIELAAARMTVLTPHELEVRLNDRFRLLAGGDRTALPQHQTLRATFDWSHDLLSPAEQVLFRRFAVFSSGVPLDTIEPVLAADDLPSSTIFDSLTGLVDKSLVQTQRSASATRFGMLETIREYARERLVESGEVADLHERHAAWILAATEEVKTRAQHSPFSGVADLGASLSEMRSALSWLEQHDPARALRLAADLSVVWFTHGWLTEGRDWLERTLTVAGEGASFGLRARAWTGLATLSVSQGDFAEAERWAQEVERNGGSYSTRVICLWVLGIVAWVRGNHDAAVRRHEEGIELARVLDFPNGKRTHLNALARVYRARGDLDRAEQLDKEALAAARRVSDESGAAPCLDGLARVAYLRGDLQQARSLAEEARAGYEGAGYVEGVASALTVSAAVELADENLEAGRAHLAEGLRRYDLIGHQAGMVNALEVAAVLAIREDRWETAARLLGVVEAQRATLGEHAAGDESLADPDLRDRLNAALGDSTEDHIRAGYELSTDEAVAQALGDV